MRRFIAGLLILVSALSLVLASTSLWVRRNVINTEVFVSNVETMVDLPEVEARINDRVTTTVLDNPDVQQAIDDALTVLPPRLQVFRPTVENGIRSLVSAGVQRLLTNDPFRPLTSAALTSAHDQLVNGQPVEFTLGMAKDLVPASARDGIAGQVLDLLPDQAGVTLLTPADAPQVYTAVDLLKSVWWWVGLLALGTLAGALSVSRHRRGTLRAWAVTTTVLTLLVLIALRVGRGVLLPQARPENRDAVGAMYDVLAGSLRSWTLWLLAAALLVLVLTLVWGRLGLVAGVRRGVASARSQLRIRREEARAARALAAEGGAAGGEVQHVFDVWMSPGSVTERLHFFAAPYTAADRTGDRGGLAEEGEDIEVVELDFDEALRMIDDGRIVDAKTVMLLYWAAVRGPFRS
jgi:8-oxo-dGTP pyrophosphatase MutT (NUDIX family)